MQVANEDAQDRLVTLMERLNIRPIVVASHPRSGTHLMMDCLRLNFAECRSWKFWGQKTDSLYLDLDRVVSHSRRLTMEQIERSIRRAQRPIIKTHALADFRHVFVGRHDPFSPRLIEFLKKHASFIYIHRDGRDSLSSGFVHWGARRGCSTLGDYLRQPDENQSSRAAAWSHHVRSWLAEPGVLRVSMEQLLSDPQIALSQFASKLGLTAPRPPFRLPRIRKPHLLSRLLCALSMRSESTAVLLTEHPHDWRQLLSHDDRAVFHRDAGELLIELGYEKSDRWVGEAVQVAGGGVQGK